MKNWLIIADDLTGAADCAIAFVNQNIKAQVSWNDKAAASWHYDAPVFSFNANSRELSSEESKAVQLKLLSQYWSSQISHFRKIDSTFRGQPVADINATLEFLVAKTGKASAVIAPAFPAMGRTVKGGSIFVHGEALEQTQIWQRDHSYDSANLQVIIEQQTGICPHVISVETLRQQQSALTQFIALQEQNEKTIFIFDAETAQDLEQVSALWQHPNPSRFFVGSAGLAHALSKGCHHDVMAPEPVKLAKGGVLMVVGSLAKVSRQATTKLVDQRPIHHFIIEPDVLIENDRALNEDVAKVHNCLAASQDVLVEIAMGEKLDMSKGPYLVKTLATKLANQKDYISGFAATGGETAATLLDAFGVEAISLRQELTPGVCLGMSSGAIEVPIVTKAGAFGDIDTLTQIYDCLVDIRKEGSF